MEHTYIPADWSPADCTGITDRPTGTCVAEFGIYVFPRKGKRRAHSPWWGGGSTWAFSKLFPLSLLPPGRPSYYIFNERLGLKLARSIRNVSGCSSLGPRRSSYLEDRSGTFIVVLSQTTRSALSQRRLSSDIHRQPTRSVPYRGRVIISCQTPYPTDKTILISKFNSWAYKFRPIVFPFTHQFYVRPCANQSIEIANRILTA